MGCEDGQEGRLIELGRIVDARARQILDKIGPLQESALLATLCIVLVDEIQNKNVKPKIKIKFLMSLKSFFDFSFSPIFLNTLFILL